MPYIPPGIGRCIHTHTQTQYLGEGGQLRLGGRTATGGAHNHAHVRGAARNVERVELVDGANKLGVIRRDGGGTRGDEESHGGE